MPGLPLNLELQTYVFACHRGTNQYRCFDFRNFAKPSPDTCLALAMSQSRGGKAALLGGRGPEAVGPGRGWGKAGGGGGGQLRSCP